MKKILVSAFAFAAALSFASAASATDSIKVGNFGNKVVAGVQLNVGVKAKKVGSVLNENTTVNVNTDIESAQQVKKIDVSQSVSGPTIGVQLNGGVKVKEVTSVKNIQQTVGSGVAINLK